MTSSHPEQTPRRRAVSQLVVMVLGLGLLLPASALASANGTFESLLDSLRSNTDDTLSDEVLTTDVAYRDSVIAEWDAGVAETGLADRIDARRDESSDAGIRTGWSFDPQDGAFRYSKVDGATPMYPGYFHVVGDSWRFRAGGRVGYALGSERLRYEGDVSIRRDWHRIGWRPVQVAPQFGWKDIHGHGIYAIAGADEQNYLERRGWSGYLSTELPQDVSAEVAYRFHEETSRHARDVFTFGDRTRLAEANRPITDGDVRAVQLQFERPRRSHRMWFSFEGETAGRDLGGDLDYDLLRGRVNWRPIMHWDDEIHFDVQGQVAAAPDMLPLQVAADPAGRSGVRGYPQSAMLGANATTLRIDYYFARDVLFSRHVPFFKGRGLQLVPFLDVGSAWTSPGQHALRDASLPASGDWKWAAGAGVRYDTGFGDILSHIRMDVAWRLDRTPEKPVFYMVLEGEPFE